MWRPPASGASQPGGRVPVRLRTRRLRSWASTNPANSATRPVPSRAIPSASSEPGRPPAAGEEASRPGRERLSDVPKPLHRSLAALRSEAAGAGGALAPLACPEDPLRGRAGDFELSGGCTGDAELSDCAGDPELSDCAGDPELSDTGAAGSTAPRCGAPDSGVTRPSRGNAPRSGLRDGGVLGSSAGRCSAVGPRFRSGAEASLSTCSGAVAVRTIWPSVPRTSASRK